MIFKTISTQQGDLWKNPYKKIQYEVRKSLDRILAMNNGTISRDEFITLFFDYPGIDVARVKLFDEYNVDFFQWKPHLKTIKKVAATLGIPLKKLDRRFFILFEETRDYLNRRKYPYLVSASHKYQAREEYFGNVYTFSIIVRPELSSHQAKPRNNFLVGHNEIALFIHTNIDIAHEGEDYFYYRMAAGSVAQEKEKLLVALYRINQVHDKLFQYFSDRNFDLFVETITNVVNNLIREDNQERKFSRCSEVDKF